MFACLLSAAIVTVGVYSCDPQDQFQDRIAELSRGNPIYEKVNEEGFELMGALKFDEALERFNLTLTEHETKPVSAMAFGRALWGRLLCNGALEREGDFLADMERAHDFFIKNQIGQKNVAAKTATRGSLGAQIVLVSGESNDWRQRHTKRQHPLERSPLFADREAQYDKFECKERVEGTRDAIVEKVNDIILCSYLRSRLINFIDGIAADCLRCCWRGTFWTECVGEIAAYFLNWKIYGIPIAPPWH